MSAPSVLYDAPGPRARQRNVLYTILFILAFAGLVWWLLTAMNEKNQLDWEKWSPYLAGTEAWTTYLLPGLANTLTAAGLSIVMALPIGAIFGIARLSDHWWIARPAGVLVEFFRAIPVLLLMFFAYTAYSEFTEIGRDIRPLYAVCTGLVIYNSSVIAEVVRAGILSLPKGQTEAAMAVGLRKGQLMTSILLPQAVTAMLPALVSQLVVIVKDTALGGVMIGYTELLNARSTFAANYADVIQSFIGVAVIFVVVNFLLTSFASWLERRLRRSKRSTGTVLGVENVDDINAGEVGGAPAAEGGKTAI